MTAAWDDRCSTRLAAPTEAGAARMTFTSPGTCQAESGYGQVFVPAVE